MTTHESTTTPHQPRDVYRLDDHPRSRRWDVGLAVAAVAAAGVFAVAITDEMSAGGDSTPAAASAAATADDCGRLWDRVRVPGRSGASFASAATALGLTLRGQWLSADGLTWEHLDGRTIVVATPQFTSTDRTECATDADNDDGSES